jgi:hypothetical protein
MLDGMHSDFLNISSGFPDWAIMRQRLRATATRQTQNVDRCGLLNLLLDSGD